MISFDVLGVVVVSFFDGICYYNFLFFVVVFIIMIFGIFILRIFLVWEVCFFGVILDFFLF